MPELIRETRPRSRGVSHCNSCGITIPRGKRYLRATLVYDSHVYDWCDCPDCELIAHHVYEWAIWSAFDEEGLTPDSYEEWARDEITCNGLHVAQARAYLARRGLQIEERDHA